MKFKIILFSLLIAFCGRDSFGVNIDGPDLTDWDGKSHVGGWIPKKEMPAGVKWYPYHAWILKERKDQPGKFCTRGRDDYPLHCIFTDEAGRRISFTMKVVGNETIDPENYRFEDSEFAQAYHKEGGASGFKFDLWKGNKDPKPTADFPYVNKFPKELFRDIRTTQGKGE